MVVGIHIGKVGIHIGKDDHLGALAVCCRQLVGGTEDKHWKDLWKADQLGGACQQANGGMCNNIITNSTASRVTFLSLKK